MKSVNTAIAEKVEEVISSLPPDRLEGREKDFLTRVYSGGLERYEKKLKEVGFTGAEVVLDAGSGYGQWAAALAELNKSVLALEYNEIRCEISRRILAALGISGVRVVNGSITALPFEDKCFDAVFSYSVVYQSNWKKALHEFYRVLTPGGRLYLNANGPGWSLYNLLENPNPSRDFSPRLNALKAVVKTISRGTLCTGADWIISRREMVRELAALGFTQIRIDGDGRINTRKDSETTAFYRGKYMGLSNVFEVLATKG